MSKEKSDLIVMQEMAEANEDIACFPDFVSVNTARGGLHITMGAPLAALQKLMSKDYALVLYMVKKDIFFKRKKDTTDYLRSTYIKELEDKVTKLEMQNDHLEEGCNERDKELVDLRESYGNVCKTVSELQIQLGNALAEVNRLKAEKKNIQPLLRELERIAKVYGYQETVDIINDYNEKQNK